MTSLSTCLALTLTWLAVAGCTAPTHLANSAAEQSQIATVGVFSVGGETVPMRTNAGTAAGTTRANQVLVRYLLPTATAPKPPIIFLPGFALSSDIYLSTPDGREGWALAFLRAGHPVYLVEPGKTTRAGVDPSAVNHGRSSQQPGGSSGRSWLFSWDQETAFRRFGFGPEAGEAFADAQLDITHWQSLVDMFSLVMVEGPRGRGMLEDSVDETIAGLEELIARTGPAVLLVHSASGIPGFRYAAANPAQVIGLINIEPVGCPGAAAASFPDVPVLSVFADHYEYREAMRGRETQCRLLVKDLANRGVTASLMRLPEMGIHGNSHLPMAERNSAQIASLLIDWTARIVE